MENQQLLERVVKLEESDKHKTQQIEKLTEKTELIHQISTNIAIVVNEIKQMREDSKSDKEELKQDIKGIKQEMKEDIKCIEKEVTNVKKEIETVKDSKAEDGNAKWEKFKWLIITSVTGTILGVIYFLLNIPK